MSKHLPSVEALVSGDDDLVSAELRLLEARAQVAHATELLDHVEKLVPAEDGRVSAANFAEELARLGCKMVEVASALSRVRAA